MTDRERSTEQEPQVGNHALFLQRLQTASRRIADAADETGVGQALMQFATSGDIDAARLLLFSEAAEGQPAAIELREGWTVDNRPARPYGIRLPLSEYPLLEFIDPNSVFVCNDLKSDERLNGRMRRLMARSGLGSFVVIPLATNRQASNVAVFGALIIGRDKPSKYETELVNAWRTLADHAATALRNLRLQDDTQNRHFLRDLERRALQLETAAEVSRAASSILDPDNLMQQVVDLVCERFGLYYVGLFLVDDASQLTGEPNRWAVLRAGTGKSGRIQLQQGHKLKVGGDSMIGWCVANAQVRISQDVAKEGTRFANPLLPETRSEVALPLISRGQVIGAMTIQSAEHGAFVPEDISVLQTMADQLANAIQNARFLEQTQTRADALSALFDVSQELNSALLQPREIAAVLAREMAELGDFGCSLSLIAPDRDTLRVLTDLYFEEGEIAHWIDEDESFRLSDYPATAQVVETHQPVVVQATDPSADPSELAYMRENKIETLAIFPLSVKGQAIGVMELESEVAYRYSPEQLNFIRTLANQAAATLENARLLQEVQNALAETDALYRSNAELNAAQTYDDILHALRRYTLVGQGASAASLIYFDRPWTEELTPQAFVYLAHWSEAQRPITSPLPLSAIPCATQVLRPEEPTLIEDITNYPSWKENDRIRFAKRFDARSAIFCPMVVGGEWIGIIVGLFPAPRSFSEHQTRLLIALASQAAIAVQNLRQLDEISSRAHHELQLRQIIATINASEDLVSNFPTIAKNLRHLVPADIVTLATYTPGDTEFTLLAGGKDSNGAHIARRGERSTLKESAPGWVIMHEKALLDNDLREAPRFDTDKYLIEEGLVSRLILPLRLREQVIGTLNLASVQPNAFSEAHVMILAQVTDQIALALERERLLEESRRALAEAQATHQRYLREEWDAVIADRPSTAWGYIDGPQGITPLEPVSWSTGAANKTDAVAEHVAEGWTPEMEEAISSARLTTCEESADEGDSISRSGLAVPIRLRGQIIGVLDFVDRGRTWTEDDKSLLESLADQVALALENQRLFEQTQRRAHRERLTGELVGKIRTASDVQSILETAAEELGQALGVSRTLIQLRRPEPSERQDAQSTDAQNGAQVDAQ